MYGWNGRATYDGAGIQTTYYPDAGENHLRKGFKKDI